MLLAFVGRYGFVMILAGDGICETWLFVTLLTGDGICQTWQFGTLLAGDGIRRTWRIRDAIGRQWHSLDETDS